MLYAFAVAALLITLAELGDKTQLLALGLACKYPPMQVLIGIFIATLVVHFFSTLVGGLIGNLVPRLWLGIGSGILFIGFGIWTLRGDKVDAEQATAPACTDRSSRPRSRSSSPSWATRRRS